MPIFMDRHDIKGITADYVSQIHQADLRLQDKFGCRTLTYWFDEKSGLAFCLVDAPEKVAIVELHKNAHGGIPHQIIEVNTNLVEAFLGRIADPRPSAGSAEPELVINESGIRTIMYIEYQIDQFHRIGNNPKSFDVFNEYIHSTIEEEGCRKIKDTDEGFLASFISGEKAVKCAGGILKKFKEYNKQNPKAKIRAAAGISIGAPVTEKEDLFGEAIRQAKQLCYVADEGEILISSELNGLRINNEFVKSLTPDEEKFLYRLMEITNKNWNKLDFRVDDYSKQIGESKSQVYRKITSLTRRSPNEFIREFRLRKALRLIEKRKGNISEIALESGFSNPSYFTQCFQKRFGLLPSEFETYVT